MCVCKCGRFQYGVICEECDFYRYKDFGTTPSLAVETVDCLRLHYDQSFYRTIGISISSQVSSDDEKITKNDNEEGDEVGSYDPITKKIHFSGKRIKQWLAFGARPTKTVLQLLTKNNILE